MTKHLAVGLGLALALAAVACSTKTVTAPPASNDPAQPPAEGETDESATDEPVPANVEPFTEAEIQALFNQRCVKCHGPSNALLDLTEPFTRETVGIATNAGQERGFCASSDYTTRIVPRDREASLLWHKVKGTQDCGSRMPYDKGNKRLTATELERFGLWIDGLSDSN